MEILSENSMKYVIIASEALPTVDFAQVGETSPNTLRYSINQSKVVLKFAGETPSFLTGNKTYTHQEISEVMKTEAWANDPPLPLE